jgi:hypothetical protein
MPYNDGETQFGLSLNLWYGHFSHCAIQRLSTFHFSCVRESEGKEILDFDDDNNSP